MDIMEAPYDKEESIKQQKAIEKKNRTDYVQTGIDYLAANGDIDRGEISDGDHTFNELYYHRMILFSIVALNNQNLAWRSRLHDDGSMYENYFIVGIDTIEGAFSYHFHMENWDHFSGIKEVEKAPKWDGHVARDIGRLLFFKEKGEFDLWKKL